VHDPAGRRLTVDGWRRVGRDFSRREVTAIEAEGTRSRITFGIRVSLSKPACKSTSIPVGGSASISMGSAIRKGRRAARNGVRRMERMSICHGKH